MPFNSSAGCSKRPPMRGSPLTFASQLRPPAVVRVSERSRQRDLLNRRMPSNFHSSNRYGVIVTWDRLLINHSQRIALRERPQKNLFTETALRRKIDNLYDSGGRINSQPLSNVTEPYPSRNIASVDARLVAAASTVANRVSREFCPPSSLSRLDAL
jgi:hypothetical protein